MFCSEQEEDVSDAEYRRYYDFSGAIQYMEDDYDVDYIVEDESPVEEFYFWSEEGSKSTLLQDAPRYAHVSPVPLEMARVIEIASNEYPLSLEVNDAKADIPLREIQHCPSFKLSTGIVTDKFKDHDTGACAWCSKVRPRTFSSALAHIGGSLLFFGTDTKLDTGVKWPYKLSRVKHTQFGRIDFPASVALPVVGDDKIKYLATLPKLKCNGQILNFGTLTPPRLVKAITHGSFSKAFKQSFSQTRGSSVTNLFLAHVNSYRIPGGGDREVTRSVRVVIDNLNQQHECTCHSPHPSDGDGDYDLV